MHDPFLKLSESAVKLGNHNLKYIHTITKYKDSLICALERNNSLDKVHFWNLRDFSDEMDTVSDAGTTLEEKLNFLGCYYAIQFINMNLKAIDALSMALVTSKESQRAGIYKEFMRRAGKKFRALTGTYMNKLLHLFMNKEDMPDFFICSVGARADQDDIDTGIITREADVTKIFGGAISKLNKQMLIHSTRLHFHLSEMLGIGRYYSTIEEFWDYLKSNTHDFVFITEVIGACKIFGSDDLFNEFKEKIIYRYFYKSGGDNKYHEAYLRGILGEIHSLLMRTPRGDKLNPKLDAIRMLKGFLYVAKTIWNIEEVNAWDILDRIKEKFPGERELYNQLDCAITSAEFLRYIYQLLVVQEEVIPLDEAYKFENMDKIASFLGYEENGSIRPWHYIVQDYHEQVKKAHEIAGILFNSLKSHLKSISVFSVLIDEIKSELYSGEKKLNTSLEYLKLSRFFRGDTFWDDLMDEIAEPDGKILKRFIDDINSLSHRRREIIIRGYIVMGRYSFYPLFVILRTLFKKGHKFGGHKLFREFNSVFLGEFPHFRDVTNRILELFDQYPELINDYLSAVDIEDIYKFEEAIKGDTGDEKSAELLSKLINLCQLYYSTNNYFKRFFQVFERYPECVKFLDSSEKLKYIGLGLFGEIEDMDLLQEKKMVLGDYYDLDFVRVALQTLKGVPLEIINDEFTEFSDNYFKTLFDICKEEVEEKEGHKINIEHLMGIYAAGGHAREQAYDDDFDIIVLLDSTDENLRKLATKIMLKMNSEIIKRGMLTHYRFIEHFGHYITMISELEEYFKQDNEEDFIDESQILGSRLIVGNRNIEKAYKDRIIQPYIFDKKDKYISQMIGDMKLRHSPPKNFLKESINIKECPGGLRDIESFLFIAKAKFEIREHISENLFNILFEIGKGEKDKLEYLKAHFYFLKNLRDLYRLTVAADDEITESSLRYVVKYLYCKYEDTTKATKYIYNKLKHCAVETDEVIEDLIKRLI